MHDRELLSKSRSESLHFQWWWMKSSFIYIRVHRYINRYAHIHKNYACTSTQRMPEIVQTCVIVPFVVNVVNCRSIASAWTNMQSASNRCHRFQADHKKYASVSNHGFSCVALRNMLSMAGVEPFFFWRSNWESGRAYTILLYQVRESSNLENSINFEDVFKASSYLYVYIPVHTSCKVRYRKRRLW